MIYQDLISKKKKVAVIGLGYVGLPLALAMARKYSVIGYDINADRLEMMRQGIDPSKEVSMEEFHECDILFTDDSRNLMDAHFYIVAVPTPVDEHKVPDLSSVVLASETIGGVLKNGDYVIYESTVYPGCTEETCLPVLESISDLRLGKDFKLGYSPERINPGDKSHKTTSILKVVSGSDQEALDEIARVYQEVITAGVFKATSIKVAEAAKVIENTQRDLNISFVNELSIIFDKMGIDTRDVLEAASTKWNFLQFYPGLVGGHCIGVDPYYLLHKAKKLGYDPQVILSGRRINDAMPAFIAKKLVKKLSSLGKSPNQCKVLVMGMTFKENVSDIRNSKVADLVFELLGFRVTVDIVDPHADAEEVRREYGLVLSDKSYGPYDAVIMAVGHSLFYSLDIDDLKNDLTEDAVIFDLKGVFRNTEIKDLTYWSL